MTPARKNAADDTGIVGMLVVGILCATAGLLSLTAAVGAAVPAVGAAVNVESTGVGAMFGYLFAACFFGLPGLVALAGVRRTRRRARAAAGEPHPVPASFAGTSSMPLPDGPGLPLRWAVAVPLMLLAAFGPWMGALVLGTWSDLAFHDLFSSYVDRPRTSFGAEFRENLATSWQQALLPALVTAGFLVRRHRMASWPAACLAMAMVMIFFGLLTRIAFDADGLAEALPDIAFGVAVIWSSHALGGLAEHVLSRPIATDVVASGMEIAFRLPRQRARLRVQDNRLVLDRIGTRRRHRRTSTPRVVIPWSALTDVRVEEQRTDVSWAPVEGRTRLVEVPAGPAVRIEATNQTWLLPAASERVAQTIVTVITIRARE
ncbi:MAG: hypothetical protein GEV28_24065 [Actinophytocola sp.]|uniref:hypothetical protein n=1 Tax=Actinophytocola sp. TaxID=1872138 RepID=UPI00132718CC|nr:hypothetical protein [Actinophytocola sp.]MPZ83299.1 hypothetical protein [Actinophytocola sp.]